MTRHADNTDLIGDFPDRMPRIKLTPMHPIDAKHNREQDRKERVRQAAANRRRTRTRSSAPPAPTVT